VNRGDPSGKFHNDRAARAALGDDWMDRFTRGVGVREPEVIYEAAVAPQAPLPSPSIGGPRWIEG
jgi:hypothetical protein